MFSYALAFLGGNVFTQFLSHLPSLHSGLLVLLMLWLFYKSQLLNNPVLQNGLKWWCTFFLGLVWTMGVATYYLNNVLPSSLEGKVLNATGYIASIPQTDDRRTQFYFQLTSLNGKPSSILTQLSWYHQAPKLKVGEKWQFEVKLKRPHGVLNPGGFDLEKRYFRKKIRAVGYVYKKGYKRLARFSWTQYPNRLRQIIFEKINTSLKNNALTGILLALSIGYQSQITEQQWQILRATGTSHLVAISGLHIGLAAGFFYYLFQFLWRRLGGLMHLIPAEEAAAIASLIGAFSYSLLSGFALPAQRALLMLSVFVFLKLLRRHFSIWQVFGVTLLAVLFIDPLSSLSSSFWLSFTAVFIIFYVTTHRVAVNKSVWARFGRVQFALTLGLMPMTLGFFHQIPLAAFFANLVAVPWMSFLVIPVTLLGTFTFLFSNHGGAFLMLFASKLLALFWPFLNMLASRESAFLHAVLPSKEMFLAMMMGVLLLLAPKGIPGRWLGVLGFFPALLYTSPSIPQGVFELTLLDVGQGLSCVVRTQNHTLVFDTGAKYSDHFDMGKAVVLPFLKQAGVDAIDVMMISHGDNDHIGGAPSILKAIKVNRILTSIPGYFKTQAAHHCYEGQHWTWDGVSFRVLYPPKDLPYQGNESSCVLQVQVAHAGFLITGDAGKKAEQYLLQHEKKHLKSSVLVAGHHGSQTSSTPAFVKAVNPQYVLFASGYLNPYHFPHKNVVERYLIQGSALENTADQGALIFKLASQKGIVEHHIFRAESGHYWNWNKTSY